MSGYLSWLAGRYARVRKEIARERELLRAQAAATGGHARTPGIVADLAVGWKHFLDFAAEVGVLLPAERERIFSEVWDSLCNAAAEQQTDLAAQDPANRFLLLLAATVTSGRGHFANRQGFEADCNPEAWGWQRRSGEGPTPNWLALGKQLGWIEDDDLYVDPEAAFAEAQRLGEEQGERLTVSQNQLHRRLKERGLLASCEVGRATTRQKLQGRERAVLHLRTATLTPQKAAVPREPGSNHGRNGTKQSPQPADHPPVRPEPHGDAADQQRHLYGRLMLNVLLSFAQFEREIIGERTRDKIAAARRKGKWAGGHPILGYDIDPQRFKLQVNEDEAARVRAIFNLYLEYQSLLPVVQELARRGWRTKRWTTRQGLERGGRPFTKTRLHHLLTNIAYIGKVRYKDELHPGEHLR
jgi:recombinase/resolvase-like protein